MCNSRHQQGHQRREESSQSSPWQGIYPDLSSFFEQPQRGYSHQNQATGRPASLMMLLNLLGLVPPCRETDQPTPSAPPPSPGPGTQENQNGFNQQIPPIHCNCRRNPLQDAVDLVIVRFHQFFLNFSAFFVRGLAVFLCIATISFLPRFLLYSCLFLFFATHLGLHVPTLIAGHLLYGLLTCFDPFFLTLISCWAFHKIFIRKRPLVDVEFWKRRLAGLN